MLQEKTEFSLETALGNKLSGGTGVKLEHLLESKRVWECMMFSSGQYLDASHVFGNVFGFSDWCSAVLSDRDALVRFLSAVSKDIFQQLTEEVEVFWADVPFFQEGGVEGPWKDPCDVDASDARTADPLQFVRPEVFSVALCLPKPTISSFCFLKKSHIVLIAPLNSILYLFFAGLLLATVVLSVHVMMELILSPKHSLQILGKQNKTKQ